MPDVRADSAVLLVAQGPSGLVVVRAGADGSIQQTSGSLLYDSQGNQLIPQFASISVSSAGDSQLVAAVANKRIRVINYALMANGTVNVKFRGGADDKTGLLYLVANAGVAPGEARYGHFQTGLGQALNINLSAAIAVGGHLTYVAVGE